MLRLRLFLLILLLLLDLLLKLIVEFAEFFELFAQRIVLLFSARIIGESLELRRDGWPSYLKERKDLVDVGTLLQTFSGLRGGHEIHLREHDRVLRWRDQWRDAFFHHRNFILRLALLLGRGAHLTLRFDVPPHIDMADISRGQVFKNPIPTILVVERDPGQEPVQSLQTRISGTCPDGARGADVLGHSDGFGRHAALDATAHKFQAFFAAAIGCGQRRVRRAPVTFRPEQIELLEIPSESRLTNNALVLSLIGNLPRSRRIARLIHRHTLAVLGQVRCELIEQVQFDFLRPLKRRA